MSLTIRHLNGDSTFLLLFSPEPHPTTSDWSNTACPYSVLIDPWLTGTSIVSAKWFSITERVEPSAISHLSEIDEPDVVICSQNKPDHTHKETLLQLRPEGKTIIAAEPGAAKAIKSWNYFDPNRVHALSKYDPKAKFGNSLRLYIPPLSFNGLPGELVISFIPAKNYATGLHNAIGITYQAPTKTKAPAPVTTIDLPKPKYFHLPLSPTSVLGSPSRPILPTSPSCQQTTTDFQDRIVPQPTSPASAGCQVLAMDSQQPITPLSSSSRRSSENRPQLISTKTASSELLSLLDQPSIRASMEELGEQRTEARPKSIPWIKAAENSEQEHSLNPNLPTPPDSPYSPVRLLATPATLVNPFTPKSSISSLPNTPHIPHTQGHNHSRTLSASNKPPTVYPARPKALSVVYTPHGITLSDLKPYVQNHLIRLPGALPLTLLLHSFEYASNPWYFGGNIMTGAVGGIAIAKALMARCWISAHDEQKDKRGVAVKLLKCEPTTAENIKRELASDQDSKKYGWTCDVRTLATGQELFLSGAERDLLVGLSWDGPKQGVQLDDSPIIQQSVFTSIG